MFLANYTNQKLHTNKKIIVERNYATIATTYKYKFYACYM